jgi:hypothetical protein
MLLQERQVRLCRAHCIVFQILPCLQRGQCRGVTSPAGLTFSGYCDRKNIGPHLTIVNLLNKYCVTHTVQYKNT